MTLNPPLIVNEIRCLTLDELPLAREAFFNFFQESKLPGKPNFDHWRNTWWDMIMKDIGYLLASLRDDKIIGVLGGLCFPCMLTGELEMVEAFWWVKPPYRGGPTGVKLLKAFEKLSKDLGAKRIKMIYMCHLNPDTMKDIYNRMGYREIEIGYMKEVV